MDTEIILFFLALVAGAVASVVGFGIGSLLTPFLTFLLASSPAAIALVAIPHFFGTLTRFALLRKSLDKQLLLHFGIWSALGGLLGALLHHWLSGKIVALVFAAALIVTGIMGLSGLGATLRFRGKLAWVAGAFSGLLGGLVGNQGGIRSAAMLSFPVTKEAFVATATAVGLIVDLARIPVYFFEHGEAIKISKGWILILCMGVVIGTLLGTKLLRNISETTFRKTVCGLILALGIFFLWSTLRAN